jgi:hypothetical protein
MLSFHREFAWIETLKLRPKMRRSRTISARKTLIFPLLASMSFLLVASANADVDGDTGAAEVNAISSASTLAKDPTTCVDLNADCSTLMINYYGDSVELALFLHGSARDEKYEADSKDYDPPDQKAASTEALSGSAAVNSRNTNQSLGIDFLRGFKDKAIDPAFKEELYTEQDSAAGAGSLHGWAFAAAASADYTSRESNPDGIPMPDGIGENSPTFWDFAHVYQWEVEENVLDSGKRDISQVALSDIYLSPKIVSTSDPEIVVCELNDQQNCRPLSD